MVSGYNPYYNPYANQFQNNYQPTVQQQMIPQQQVVKVNGENGARAYAMGANSSALLLDECGTIVWLATTDGASYKTVTPYDISPHQVAKQPDFSTLESRIQRLEEIINEQSTTITENSSATKRRSNGKPIGSNDSEN